MHVTAADSLLATAHSDPECDTEPSCDTGPHTTQNPTKVTEENPPKDVEENAQNCVEKTSPKPRKAAVRRPSLLKTVVSIKVRRQ